VDDLAGSPPHQAVPAEPAGTGPVRAEAGHVRQPEERHAHEPLPFLNAHVDGGNLHAQVLTRVAALESRLDRLAAVQSRCQSAIDASLRQAEHVSAIDKRLSMLRQDDLSLAHTADALRRLEQHVAELTLQMKQIIHAQNELAPGWRRSETLQELVCASVETPAVASGSQARNDMPLYRPAVARRTLMNMGLSGLLPRLRMVGSLDRRHLFLVRTAAGALALMGFVALLLWHVLAPAADGANPSTEPLATVTVVPASLAFLPGLSSPGVSDSATRIAADRTPEATTPRTTDRSKPRDPLEQAPDGGRPAASKEPNRAAAEREDPDRRAVVLGALSVQSLPAGATVFVDQERVGETPLQVKSLRAGSHVVAVERDGFQRWTSAVRVSAETRAQVIAYLQPD